MDHLRVAADSSEELVSELFEAQIAAHFYVTKQTKDEYAQRFIRHLYRIEAAGQSLHNSLLEIGSVFHAVANITEAASVHDLLARIAGDVCADVVDAMLRKACPEKWPPETPGEYECPPQLPCEREFLEYVDAAIGAFVKSAPTDDDLNRWSNLRQQELARAIVANPPSKVDTKVDKKKLSTRGLTPAARQCAKRFKAARKAGEKTPMEDVIRAYLADNPKAKYSSIRRSLSAHPEAWKVDTKVDKAGNKAVR